jgi:hypothetical protein
MCIQALDYEKKTGKDLSEFFGSVKNKLQLTESIQLYKDIIKKR